MELERNTEERPLSVQAEFATLEPIFHHPEIGTSRGVYEQMTEPSFWEVGAFGRSALRWNDAPSND